MESARTSNVVHCLTNLAWRKDPDRGPVSDKAGSFFAVLRWPLADGDFSFVTGSSDEPDGDNGGDHRPCAECAFWDSGLLAIFLFALAAHGFSCEHPYG